MRKKSLPNADPTVEPPQAAVPTVEPPTAAHPTVEPQDPLRKCLKCGKVAYLGKNGCANPDCVT